MSTIETHCPTPQDFWNEIFEAFLIATKSDKRKLITAYWFVCRFWDKFKAKPYWGEWNDKLGVLRAELASDYQWLDKREKFHQKVFNDINQWWKLFDVKTVVKEKGGSFDQKIRNNLDVGQSMSGKKVRSQNTPIEMIDMPNFRYGGQDRADFLATEMNISTGYLAGDPDDPTGKRKMLKPDFSQSKTTGKEKDKGHSHQDRTINTKQQPTQKLSQILRLFSMVDYNLNDIWAKYNNYFRGVGRPLGMLTPDPYLPTFRYKTGYEIEQEMLPEEERKKRQEEKEEGGFIQISQGEWKTQFDKGESVEEKWILENLQRYKTFLEKQVTKVFGSTQEGIARNIEYCKGLINAYERPLNYVPLSDWNRKMDSVVGYGLFKQALREQMEIIEGEREAGEERPTGTEQVFWNLTGYPGVGKTLIVQTYAEAMERPYFQIDNAGSSDPRILNGKTQSYKGADAGGMLKAIATKQCQMRIPVDFLKRELKTLTDRPKPTKRQKERIEKLTAQIQDIETNSKTITWGGQTVLGIQEDRNSSAPVVLIDEYEKVKRPEGLAVMQALGKYSDPAAISRITDEFFDFPLDFGEVILLITVNNWWEVPPFIHSRFTPVLIDVMNYQQRLAIVDWTVKNGIRKAFPAREGEDGKLYPHGHDKVGLKMSGADIDEINKGKGEFTVRQNTIIALFNDNEFKRCLIDEQWGVRGIRQGILAKCFTFLRLLNIRRVVPNDKDTPTLLSKLLERGEGALGFPLKGNSEEVKKRCKAKFDESGGADIVIIYNLGDEEKWKELNKDDPFLEGKNKNRLVIEYKRNVELEINRETLTTTGYTDSVMRRFREGDYKWPDPLPWWVGFKPPIMTEVKENKGKPPPKQ